MVEYWVTCINKIPRDNPHEGITHLGGINGIFSRDIRWRFTREEVIHHIQTGSRFYTLVDKKRADVRIVNGPNGPYLQTHADGRDNNNLLALPECSS